MDVVDAPEVHRPGLKRESLAPLAGLRVWAVLLLGLSLGVGSALRLWLSTHDDGIFWPDEIYQSLEPAHWTVFGYGLVPWEFVSGARNWAFPGNKVSASSISSVGRSSSIAR